MQPSKAYTRSTETFPEIFDPRSSERKYKKRFIHATTTGNCFVKFSYEIDSLIDKIATPGLSSISEGTVLNSSGEGRCRTVHDEAVGLAFDYKICTLNSSVSDEILRPCKVPANISIDSLLSIVINSYHSPRDKILAIFRKLAIQRYTQTHLPIMIINTDEGRPIEYTRYQQVIDIQRYIQEWVAYEQSKPAIDQEVSLWCDFSAGELSDYYGLDYTKASVENQAVLDNPKFFDR